MTRARRAGTRSCRLTVVEPGGPATPTRTITVEPGETAHQALMRAGLATATPCAGKGICGKCLVELQGIAPQRVELTPHRALSPEQARRGLRLACQLRPTADLTIRIIAPTAADAPLRAEGAAATGHRRPRQEGAPTGLAIDLGTSTIVLTLVDLGSGEELATASADNPQARLAGHDVVSRIAHGSTPEGLAALSRVVREALGALIDRACGEAGAAREHLTEAVIGGNPTMLQLAAGLDPAPLGRAPFRVDLAAGDHPASAFGLGLAPSARVHLPPLLQAYFGSDISAGLLACDGDGASFFADDGGTELFVDVGTNGELAARSGGRYLATSAAAGPAFEGMGLSCGMRATAGAVEAVAAGAGAELSLLTIGRTAPRGLCGSGVVDLTATLLAKGAIAPSGRIVRGAPGVVCDADGKPAIAVAPGVLLTQQDVRQIQLAKGAIRTAIDVLLAELGVEPRSLDQVTIAGGFGRALRPASLEAIGLIPPDTAARVRFAGNTSLRGCARLLREPAIRPRLARWLASFEYLSLAERRGFSAAFVDRLAFSAPPARC